VVAHQHVDAGVAIRFTFLPCCSELLQEVVGQLQDVGCPLRSGGTKIANTLRR
jgi:hypothetical protein